MNYLARRAVYDTIFDQKSPLPMSHTITEIPNAGVVILDNEEKFAAIDAAGRLVLFSVRVGDPVSIQHSGGKIFMRVANKEFRVLRAY
ncbi:MAG TPA: hypothetical protein VIT91_17670 [Chthoniobacterales bacterium]